MLYIKVSIPILLFKTFIYSYSESGKKLFIGQGVLVKFNHREVSGYVIDISKKTNFTSKINPIISLNPNSIRISNELIQTINWMSNYYICPIGKTLKATIPYQLYKTKVLKEKYIKISSVGLSKISELNFKKQLKILKYLANKNDFVRLKSLKSISTSYNQTCNSLVKKGYVFITEKIDNSNLQKPSFDEIILNHEQNNIYKNIVKQIKTKKQNIVLSGVPGCGKTEVYIQVIKDIINKNQQAIVLVPEISLIQQTYLRLKNIFKGSVGYWHSKLSNKEKTNIINKIKKNEIKIIVGARSALFVPFQDLGIIVIDEEQENSYKQSGQAPYYNARDVAIIRSKFSKAALLLCSATLSLESFYNINNNNFNYHYIKNRFHDSQIPDITLIDMEKEIYKNNIPIFSQYLIKKIHETLERNEQIILLQNRRSYSYILKCVSCNKTNNCPHCNVSLKYHKNNNLLQCHHCDFKKKFNKFCNNCKNNSIKLYGVGTQRIEEILKKLFPSSTILRYDKDTTGTKSNYLEILNQFENHKADILIGTQMIAKGLDFKNVSLAAIINADLSMMFPDFRSGEKTFQLLYQFIGRAGRHKKNSTAIIQSSNVNDEYIKFACNNELDNYYNHALIERKDLDYPPYTRLIKINVSGNNKKIIINKINSIHKKLLLYKDIVILGPTECPIEKINNLFRSHLIIKNQKSDWMKFYKFIINHIGLNEFEKKSKNFKLTIDVDPISFL